VGFAVPIDAARGRRHGGTSSRSEMRPATDYNTSGANTEFPNGGRCDRTRRPRVATSTTTAVRTSEPTCVPLDVNFDVRADHSPPAAQTRLVQIAAVVVERDTRELQPPTAPYAPPNPRMCHPRNFRGQADRVPPASRRGYACGGRLPYAAGVKNRLCRFC